MSTKKTKIFRRTILLSGIALIAAAAMPGIRHAIAAPNSKNTIRAVMHADLRVLDPVWTTANITINHGAMIYDTLFGLDKDYVPQPQMVGEHKVSDDKLTHTFTLRDGLAFSDGSPVTTEDVVASLRRWGARNNAGKHMMQYVKDMPIVDAKTFQIVFSEPYGLVLNALAENGTVIMRKKEALTDPNQQITEYIGSGPFVFNQKETQLGHRYVYDRNPGYVPRKEPPSGTAGGKVVKVERVIFENMADEQTAMSALQAGEIDFMEMPPQDLLDVLRSDNNLNVEVLNKTGHMGWMRVNHLHPPFDNVYARQAMLYLIDQQEIMRAAFGSSDLWKKCGAYLACDTAMESDVNTDWLKGGQNIEKARELFKKAGYDGRPVVVLHATTHYLANPAALLTVQWLKQAGVNAELATSDWGTMLVRRNSKAAPTEGGWSIFFTAATGHSLSNPVTASGHATNGEAAWFGWPNDPKQEALREKWARTPTLEGQKAVAQEIQENAWNFVPHMYLGQFYRAAAWRKNVTGVIGVPEVVPFWNMEKK